MCRCGRPSLGLPLMFNCDSDSRRERKDKYLVLKEFCAGGERGERFILASPSFFACYLIIIMIYTYQLWGSLVDVSKLRQKVHRLDQQRRMLLQQVLRPPPMIGASLYQMRRRCGKPRCKCTRGHLHTSWYLSRRQEGRTKLTYIGRIVPDWLAKGIHRYQQHQKILARIRKIDAEISTSLNTLRDEKLSSFEQARKDRQWS